MSPDTGSMCSGRAALYNPAVPSCCSCSSLQCKVPLCWPEHLPLAPGHNTSHGLGLSSICYSLFLACALKGSASRAGEAQSQTPCEKKVHNIYVMVLFNLRLHAASKTQLLQWHSPLPATFQSTMLKLKTSWQERIKAITGSLPFPSATSSCSLTAAPQLHKTHCLPQYKACTAAGHYQHHLQCQVPRWEITHWSTCSHWC